MLSVIITAASQNNWPKNQGPQSLVNVDQNKTLIEDQILKIQGVYPNAEIITVVGYESDKIIKKIASNVKILENELHAETGTLRTAAIALRICSYDKVLIINGDILFEESAIETFSDDKSFVLARKETSHNEVGVNIVNGRVTSFAFGISPRWSKIIYLAPQELDTFKKIAHSKGKRKWCIHEACNSLIDQGGILYTKINKKTAEEVTYDSSL